jgi:cell division protein ZapA
MSKPVKVEIYGQTYAIGGDLEETYVQKLAEYVDAKMRAVAEATKTVDSVKLAVLTALAVADELHALREERGEEAERLKEKAERCLNLVERALKQTA